MSNSIKSLKTKNFEWIFIVGCFLIPFVTIKPFSININYGDYCLLLYGIILLFNSSQKKYGAILFQVKRPLNTWYFGGGLILLGLMISDIFSRVPSPPDMLAQYLQYFFVYFFLVWIIQNTRYQSLRKGMFSLILGYSVAGLTSSFLFLGLPDIYYKLYSQGYFIQTLRVTPFMNANAFAKNFAVLVPIIFLFSSQIGFSRLHRIIIIIICMLTVILSGSFGGIISIVISILLCIIYTALMRKIHLSYKHLVVIMLVILFVIFSMDYIREFYNTWNIFGVIRRRLEPVLQSGDIYQAGSLGLKQQLMNYGVELINNNPIIGIGTRKFNVLSEGITMHNSYLLLWVEGGVFSFIGFLIILMTPYFRSNRISKFLSDERLMEMIVYLIFAIASYTNNAVYQRDSMIILLLSTSILSSKGVRTKSWTSQ